ncbi:MAG: hypothetical protein WD424_05935 [Paenibacillaceae bacterium]
MLRRISMNTLIGQEKRAATLFLILLLSVVFMSDFGVVSFLSNGFSLKLLLPYLFLYLQIPLVIVFINKRNPGYIKYMFFLTYISISTFNEIFLFLGTTHYEGGSVAEMFLILFSPIFVNKRYFWTVTVGIIIKYCLEGILLKSTVVFFPMGLDLVFALVAFIILNRFIGYIGALNDSYNKQFEATLSSGMVIMNHTFKNEITKIQYLNNRMKELNKNQANQDNNTMIESIQQATSHMLSMSNRLQAKTGEIILLEGTHNLISVVNSAVSMIEPNLQKNHVQCIQDFSLMWI